MSDKSARSGTENDSKEELAYVAKLASILDRKIRQYAENSSPSLSRALNSKPTWFATYLLSRSIELDPDKWNKVEESADEYHKHMGVTKPQYYTVNPSSQDSDQSLRSYQVSRGLSMLSMQFQIERKRGKKNILSKATTKIRFNGTPSAWKLPEEFNRLQNMINKPEALERLKHGLNAAGILKPFLLCVAYDTLNNLKISNDEKLSFFYTVISKSGPNKPSKERYEEYLRTVRGWLDRMDEKQIQAFAEYLSQGMSDNPIVLRMILLYTLSKN